MASKEQPSRVYAASSFGGWLRQMREAKALPQRVIAAGLDMDSSHYGKVEQGKRFFADDQLCAVARLLAVAEDEVRRRHRAAKVYQVCGYDHDEAAAVALLVQEQAAPYIVNNPVDRRPKKK